MPNNPDTISSGTSYYSNTYRQDHDFRQAERVILDRVRRLDSIQSDQHRLENDLQKQFQNKLRLPPSSIVFVVGVGRFIVLAILMPPYYAMYAAPRWLFLQLKPFILEGMEKGEDLLKMIQSFIILQLNHLFQLVIEKPSGFLQNLFKKFDRPKRQKVEKEPNRLMEKTAVFFKTATLHLLQPIKYLKTKVQEFKKNLILQTEHLYPALKKFLKEKGTNFQNVVQKKLENIKTLLAPHFQRLNTGTNRLVNFAIRKVQKGFEKALAPIKIAYRFLQKTMLEHLIPPLKNYLRGIIEEKIKAPFKKAISTVMAPLKHIAKFTSTQLETLKEHAAMQLQTFLKAASIPMGLFVNSSAKVLSSFSSNIKLSTSSFRHYLASVKRVCNTVGRGMQQLTDKAKSYLKEKMGDLKEWGDKKKKALKKLAAIAITKIKQIYKGLWDRLKRLFLKIREIFTKFCRSLRIAFIWVKILVRYNFYN